MRCCRGKRGIKDFVIEALGGGEAQTDLAGLLTESKDPRVAAFEKDQAAYLYKNLSALQNQIGLKELVIDKLSSASEWKQGLDQFLPAIAPLKTDQLSNGQLEYLYGLRGDLEKTVTDRPTQGQSVAVKAFAVDRMSDQKLSPSQATAAVEDLKAFGYKGKLLDFAQSKAASRGAEQLKLALAAVDTEEKQAVDAAKRRGSCRCRSECPPASRNARPSARGAGRPRFRCTGSLRVSRLGIR